MGEDGVKLVLLRLNKEENCKIVYNARWTTMNEVSEANQSWIELEK